MRPKVNDLAVAEGPGVRERLLELDARVTRCRAGSVDEDKVIT
jgi:hypothetical protein